MNFRKDINALRAFAVISVVFFHFKPSMLAGGFAGVDVFFVISGFLMTGIIFRGMERGDFSVIKFYEARAKRIIPPLAALCFTLLVFGWFFLTPSDYQALSKHSLSSVSFLSNLIYWQESGYFDASSHEKWLLHTWSLSVEWQFYILYPLCLVFINKFMSTKSVKLLILATTFIALAISIWITYKSPSFAYYSLITRAWEMLLGGVAFLYPFKLKDLNKRLFEIFGITAIVLSFIFVSNKSPWPGYLALIPVLGTCLIIQSQRNTSKITNYIIFQKLGTWSYSIYLWHWPLVVIIHTYALPEAYSYIGICLSVILGFLSYKYVESIKYQKNKNPFKNHVPIYSGLVIIAISSVIYLYEGLPVKLRLTKEQLLITKQMERSNKDIECSKVIKGISPSCKYGSGEVKAIVIGDSHAQSMVEHIGNIAEKHNGAVIFWGLSGCNTINGLFQFNSSGDKDYNCGDFVNNSINNAKNLYPSIPVIVINRSGHNLYGRNELKVDYPPKRFVDHVFEKRSDLYRNSIAKHMIKTVCEFSESNPVFVLKPTPELKINVPKHMFQSTLFNQKYSRVELSIDEYNNRHQLTFKIQNEMKKKCGAIIIDPLPYLCGDNRCYGDLNGVPLYFDDNHLSHYGSELVSPIWESVFNHNQ